MKVQIIFKNGRNMILDGIEDYSSEGAYWKLKDENGNYSYIEDEIMYIGRPEERLEIMTLPLPEKKSFFKGLL